MAWTYDQIKESNDLYIPMTLGERRGLRGYDAYRFTGNKRFLLNIEYRHILPFRTENFTFGQVFFLDAGYIWKPSETVNINDLKTSIGWGFTARCSQYFRS